MGKQLNYWMDYESFLCVAQEAVHLGCTIVREDAASGSVLKSGDIRVVTPDIKSYYFHLPEAGDIAVRTINGRERLDHGFSASGNAIIEAGYSFVAHEPERKEIRRARIYCITGYYDDHGAYIARPRCLTKVYDSLARCVKRIAPYTELTDLRVSTRGEDYGEKYEYIHKEYVSKTCLRMREQEGYRLC